MSFISIKYALFLIVTVIAYYIIPQKKRWLVLLFASYIFYYLSSGKLLVCLILSTLSVYAGGLLIDRENIKEKYLGLNLEKEKKKELKNKAKSNKRKIILFMILINFGILGLFKYSGFACKNLNYILNVVGLPKIKVLKFALPIGISYYTLMTISYVTDVYRGKYKAEENLGKLALFLSFFPQIIEGPISKFEQTAEQLYSGHKFNIDNIIKGASLIIFGIFKKLVIADRAGIYVNNVFGNNICGFTMFVGAVLYTLQIYAEFSGCMDIVIGSGKMFGIDLPENFRRPFFSRSIQEFWRRWHITLGAWIKDYIFYPISLSKLNMKAGGFFKKHFPKGMAKFLIVAFPLLFVWLYNGIWHGASWKYIAYGIYYYILIMIGILLTPLLSNMRKHLKINEKNIFYRIYEILRTSLFVIIGMMLFRSHSLRTFFMNFTNMFKSSNKVILDFGLEKFDFIILTIYVISLIFIGILKEKGIDIYEKLRSRNIIIRYAVYLFAIISIVILGIYGKGYDTSSFIYGQF